MAIVKQTITSLDYLSVEKLETMIDTFEKRLKDPKLSKAAAKKIAALREKYTKQKGKTINLYLKNKNKKNHKKALAGITKSYLSVVTLYNLMNKKTKDLSDKPEFWQNLMQHPVENSFVAAGGGIMIISALATKIGEQAVVEHLGDAIVFLAKKFWDLDPSTKIFIGGAALLAGGLIAKQIRRNKEMKATEVYNAEQEANKGTARDHKFIADPKNKDALVAEAMSDPTVMKYLEDFAYNPYNGGHQKTAIAIIKEAKDKMSKNELEVKKIQLAGALNSNDKVLFWTAADRKFKEGTISCAEALSMKAKLEDIQKDLADKNLTLSVTDFETKVYATPEATAVQNKINNLLTLSGTNLEQLFISDSTKKIYGTEADFVNSLDLDKVADPVVCAELERVAKEAYRKKKGEANYDSKKARYNAEFDPSTNKFKIDGMTQAEIENNYEAALIKAAITAGLLTEKDAKKNSFDLDEIYKNHQTTLRDILKESIPQGPQMGA